MINVYSFTDVSVTISHPAVGQKVLNGEGLGSISVNMSNDRTVHDIAADGSVMPSKIKANNGVVSMSIQQTSSLHAWLLKWYNYLDTAPSSQWAKTQITIRSTTMGELITATGVSPQKLPDKPYQQQGQQIVWNMMAAGIQQESV